MNKKLEDTEIRIAYENRCYGDILVAVEKDIKKVRLQAKKEMFDDVMQIYTRLKDFQHETGCKKAYEHDLQNLVTKLFLGFERKHSSKP